MTARPLIHRSPIPGLGISAGITITLLSLEVLLPIGALLLKGALAGPERLWTEVNTPRIWAALWLSFRLSFLAALFNLIFGVTLAWVLVRYRFAGRRLIDAAVDLPFALPTAVAGIALTALYAPNGVFGQFAAQFGLLAVHVVADASAGERPDARSDQRVLAALLAAVGVGQVAKRRAAQGAGDGARAGVVADGLSGVGVDRGARGQGPGADDTCRKGGPVAHL